MSEQESKPRDSSGRDRHGPGWLHASTRGRKLRFGVAASLLLAAGIVVGGLGATALNASAFGGRGHGHGGNPERMMERMQDKVSWMLSSVEATPQQKSQVESIVSETVERMRSFRQDRREGRREFMAELLRSEINRDSLEQLRQRHLASMDQMSTVLVDGAVRAAEVLTPEQREELLAKRPFGRR